MSITASVVVPIIVIVFDSPFGLTITIVGARWQDLKGCSVDECTDSIFGGIRQPWNPILKPSDVTVSGSRTMTTNDMIQTL
jgi:hypothetical protein